jgi:hypothetical protein
MPEPRRDTAPPPEAPYHSRESVDEMDTDRNREQEEREEPDDDRRDSDAEHEPPSEPTPR